MKVLGLSNLNSRSRCHVFARISCMVLRNILYSRIFQLPVIQHGTNVHQPATTSVIPRRLVLSCGLIYSWVIQWLKVYSEYNKLRNDTRGWCWWHRDSVNHQSGRRGRTVGIQYNTVGIPSFQIFNSKSRAPFLAKHRGTNVGSFVWAHTSPHETFLSLCLCAAFVSPLRTGLRLNLSVDTNTAHSNKYFWRKKNGRFFIP